MALVACELSCMLMKADTNVAACYRASVDTLTKNMLLIAILRPTGLQLLSDTRMTPQDSRIFIWIRKHLLLTPVFVSRKCLKCRFWVNCPLSLYKYFHCNTAFTS